MTKCQLAPSLAAPYVELRVKRRLQLTDCRKMQKKRGKNGKGGGGSLATLVKAEKKMPIQTTFCVLKADL